MKNFKDRQKISFAVISDLHCQELPQDQKSTNQESYFIVGAQRVPSDTHPMQSLLKLINTHGIEANVIICCGDMSNKISRSGLLQSWDSIRTDLKDALKSKEVYCTLGNHDVESRSLDGTPFDTARSIDENFPFRDNSDNDCYWANGYCLQNLEGIADFLAINTAHDHWNEPAARTGTFSPRNIQTLGEYLTSKPTAPIRIAFFHHHPTLHASSVSNLTDVLPTGADLLQLLSKHGFQLIIHGHRHQPHITWYTDTSIPLYVFCAGSFSAFLNILASRTRNLFHLVEVEVDNKNSSGLNGVIKTWEFNWGKGWRPSSQNSADFPHILHIGRRPEDNLGEKINQYFVDTDKAYLVGPNLLKTFPSLKYVFPHDLGALVQQLENNYEIIANFEENGALSGLWRI